MWFGSGSGSVSGRRAGAVRGCGRGRSGGLVWVGVGRCGLSGKRGV